MSGPAAAVAALAVAAVLVAIVELATRRIERRHDERARSNTRAIKELQRHDQRQP
jgi:hypothetical protein